MKPKLWNVTARRPGVRVGSSSSASLRRSIAAVRPDVLITTSARPRSGREELALASDAVGDAALGRERVATPRLLVPRHQRLFVGVEEQHAMRDAGGPQVVEHRREAIEVLAAADVGYDCGVLDLRARMHEQVDKRADHFRRQVVDAEVALVFEGGHRGGLSGAREPGDDHQVDQGGALLAWRLCWLLELIHFCHIHGRKLDGEEGVIGVTGPYQTPVLCSSR